jgi:hypothetical protein
MMLMFFAMDTDFVDLFDRELFITQALGFEASQHRHSPEHG